MDQKVGNPVIVSTGKQNANLCILAKLRNYTPFLWFLMKIWDKFKWKTGMTSPSEVSELGNTVSKFTVKMVIFPQSWPNHPWHPHDQVCYYWRHQYHLSWWQSIHLCITNMAKNAQFLFLPYFSTIQEMDLILALYRSRWTFNHVRATFHDIWKCLME